MTGGIVHFRTSASIPSAVTCYLLPHEKMVISVRRHPGIYAGHAAFLACACAAASVLTAVTGSGALVLAAAWGACCVICLSLIMRAAAWRDTYFVVTDTRLIFITGLVTRKVTTVPLRDIGDLQLWRPGLGRLIGYGKFVAQSKRPGHRMPKMKYMPYPEQLFLEVSGLLLPDGGEDSRAHEREDSA